MVHKELQVRYKRTIFGFLWIIINPLIQMAVIGFIFPFFVKEQLPYYLLYLFTGLLTWNFFTLSLGKATSSIVFETALIKKARFPRSIIPLSIVISNVVNMLISFLLLLIPTVYLRLFAIVSIGYFFVGLVLLITFTIGLSLFSSALNVRYRDINFFVQALLIVWFYATPIMYPMRFIPHAYAPLWFLNPMTSVVQLFQHVFASYPLPSLPLFVVNTITVFIVLGFGILTFRRESQNFDDWL